MTDGKSVWIVVYSHKYGVDTFVEDSELKADLRSAMIILSWIHDIQDPEKVSSIVEAIQGGDYDEARCRYMEAMHGEEGLTIDGGVIGSEEEQAMAKGVIEGCFAALRYIAEEEDTEQGDVQ